MRPDLLESLDQFHAEKLINSLRIGTVPNDHLELFSVGREFWLNAIEEDLDFVSHGASKIRFISASYGGGKTHFLNLIKKKALNRNFIASYVELHSKEAPMDKFEVIFPKVMRGIITLDSSYGLENIFNGWTNNFNYYERKEIETKLKEIAHSMDFRAALRSYLEFSVLDSPESKDYLLNILGWLCGKKLPPKIANKTGIRTPISITNASEVLGSFLKFIRFNKYSGLTLFLDEAEAVTSLSQSLRRDEANQNIRKLLDNADNHSGIYIIFATTPKFLDDPQVGARSYPALWERIKDVLNINLRYPNKRSTVVPLQPLKKEEFIKLGEVITSIHGLAYNWNPVNVFNSEMNKKFANRFENTASEKLVRTFIRSLITVLDIMEQNEDFDPMEEIDEINFSDN